MVPVELRGMAELTVVQANRLCQQAALHWPEVHGGSRQAARDRLVIGHDAAAGEEYLTSQGRQEDGTQWSFGIREQSA